MILKSAGGLPPKGQDMNQILYELSALGRWSSTGALNTFDSEFASEISGYPSGAMLISDDGERIFINTTEGNLSDPNSNGAGWKDVLSYLGLGEGSALPVGVPVPWPSATPPAGWLKCNGAPFTTSQYPKLATVYPSGVLPDLRGEFLRGWDDGRGVDVGRAILSSQGDAIRNITGKFGNAQLYPAINTDGAFVGSDNVSQTNGLTQSSPGIGNGSVNFRFDASAVVPVASENRPRNVAFNYIVRAA
ncbi:tail fiber protein [Escherichia coli]|nr:tail fiber protein [Escherichia coli]HDX5546627.1 tail fiber protein [Escherichia coli]HDX5630334.1 tail fiber protein [Escherichia coli]